MYVQFKNWAAFSTVHPQRYIGAKDKNGFRCLPIKPFEVCSLMLGDAKMYLATGHKEEEEAEYDA
jgi:hypothetical protein